MIKYNISKACQLFLITAFSFFNASLMAMQKETYKDRVANHHSYTKSIQLAGAVATTALNMAKTTLQNNNDAWCMAGISSDDENVEKTLISKTMGILGSYGTKASPYSIEIYLKLTAQGDKGFIHIDWAHPNHETGTVETGLSSADLSLLLQPQETMPDISKDTSH